MAVIESVFWVSSKEEEKEKKIRWFQFFSETKYCCKLQKKIWKKKQKASKESLIRLEN